MINNFSINKANELYTAKIKVVLFLWHSNFVICYLC